MIDVHPIAHLSLFPTSVLHHLFSPLDLLGVALLAIMGLVYSLAGWRQKKDGPIGGSGKVVGIVGRMGSGKSYFAVRMAYRRLCAGATVCTNFTMNLANHADTYEAWSEAFPEVDEAIELASLEWVLTAAGPARTPLVLAEDLPLTTCLRGVRYKHELVKKDGRPVLRKDGSQDLQWRTHKCPCDVLKGTWRQFHGWDDFSTLDNAVVIVDEAHLYAPSNKGVLLPTAARWKLSQARKFRLDVYWITQHENRVNPVLKDLTNFMYLCRSFAGGVLFLAKGWEPERFRRKNAHLDRVAYRLDLRIANLYNSLQILDLDDHLAGGRDASSIALARKVAANYNERNGYGDTTSGARIAHRATAAPHPAPAAPRPAVMAKAVPVAPRPAPAAPEPAERPEGRTGRCDHERRNHERLGTCRKCPPVLAEVGS